MKRFLPIASRGAMITLLALAGVTATGSAQAATTVYTDRAQFDAATTSATSQSFPATAVNTSGPIYTFNGVTFNTSLAGDRTIIKDGSFLNAVYLATGFGGSVTISSTLNAFGLYLGSVFDPSFSFSYNAGGTTGTFTMLSNDKNPGKFIGFSGTSPVSVTFNTSSGREFDIVSYVTTTNPVVTPPVITPPTAAVPEPATWAMMIAGFGLVGGAMRRRKTSVAFA